MQKSSDILTKHPVNKKRIDEGKKPANMIWLWGQGTKPQMPVFKDNYGLRGATITGVDLIKGIGTYLGLTNVHVPGATGYYRRFAETESSLLLKWPTPNGVINRISSTVGRYPSPRIIPGSCS